MDVDVAHAYDVCDAAWADISDAKVDDVATAALTDGVDDSDKAESYEPVY